MLRFLSGLVLSAVIRLVGTSEPKFQEGELCRLRETDCCNDFVQQNAGAIVVIKGVDKYVYTVNVIADAEKTGTCCEYALEAL